MYASSETLRVSDDQKELRAPEIAISGALRAVLVFDALDGLATSCARARRRPARAQCGLRL